jgi:hypothetical protein
MLPTKFRFIWLSGFRGEDFFRNRPIRNKNCLWWPCLLTNPAEMISLYRGPLYKDCSFRPDALTNMATTGSSCF